METKCGHHFGGNCTKTWLINKNCPIYRAKLFPSPPSASGDDNKLDDGILNLMNEPGDGFAFDDESMEYDAYDSDDIW